MNPPRFAPVVALLVSAAISAPALAQEAADRIWSGASILTMNDKALHAEAVAERGGKIVAVGPRAHNGVAYRNCGGTYYQPRYQGSSVSYVVVNRPYP